MYGEVSIHGTTSYKFTFLFQVLTLEHEYYRCRDKSSNRCHGGGTPTQAQHHAASLHPLNLGPLFFTSLLGFSIIAITIFIGSFDLELS